MASGMGSGGKGNIVWMIIWFLILWLLAWPVGAFFAGWYVLIAPCGACCDCAKSLGDTLLTIVQWPIRAAQFMMDGKEGFEF